MRILILDTYYPPFLRRFYADHPGLEKCGYDQQLEALLETHFGTSDSYSWHLRQLGHQATELVLNCVPLQAQWARERGIRTPLVGLRAGASARAATLRLPPVRALLMRIARAQIEEVNPDVVYLQDVRFIPGRDLARLRRSGYLVVGQISSRSPGRDHVTQLDLVVTSFPHFVDRYQALGVETVYLPLAFDNRILKRLQLEGMNPRTHGEQRRNVVFVGGMQPRVWRSGVATLERLVQAGIELDLFGYGIETLPSSSPLRTRYRGEAWGLDMYRLYASARIAVNRHGAVTDGYANNMRMYEATGMGALLMTEVAPNLPELFAPGREVVAYDGPDDLVDKVRHFLVADVERQTVAAAGQRRTLTQHTYGQRMAQLAHFLEGRL